MFQWFRYVFDKIGSPELDWIQVEVTSHCNAACIYCPNPLITKKQHMPLALFKRLLPYLGYTDLVYLQGWGEPLLNKDIFNMIRACKAKGKRVGFTTNGMLLSDENIRRIVDLDVDILCISLAGTRPATHNRIRTGTDFEKIISNLDRLREIRAQKNALRPSLHFAYIMMNGNFHELPKVVELAEKLAVKEVVASNLTLITKEALQPEALFNHPEKRQYFINTLEEIVKDAQQSNLSFTYSSPVLEKELKYCSENIYYSCVVSANGDVSPCVFTLPTLSRANGTPMTCIFRNRQLRFYPLSFGNIGTETLTRIWNKKAYLEFKRFFDPERNKPVPDTIPKPRNCLNCYKGLNASKPIAS